MQKNLGLLTTLMVFLTLWTACGPPPSPKPDESPPEALKNEVVVLGMIHGGHRDSELYGIDVVKSLIRAIAPDEVLVEIPPDRFPTAMAQFQENGAITEPRVLRFPEYVDALFPLTQEMNFKIVPTAGWTRPMAEARSLALDAIRNDPLRADEWAAYEEANARSQAAVLAGGAEDDPRWIHTDAYDEALEISLSVYNDLFNEELGAGGWDNINAAHYAHIAHALDENTRQGKRFLITYGAGHKGWFLRQLRQRNDVELLDVGEFLSQSPK